MAREAKPMDTLYSRIWGSQEEEKHGMTLWTETETRHKGVAIVLDPCSSVSEIFPWKKELWTGHWMAERFQPHGAAFVLVNVYAPPDQSAREALFRRLRSVLLLHDGQIIIGGDFK